MSKLRLPNERAYERAGTGKHSLFSQEHCCICGKSVGLKTEWLLATRETDGGFESAIHHPEDANPSERHGHDIWVAPIGSDCLRRHPEFKTFVLNRIVPENGTASSPNTSVEAKAGRIAQLEGK